MKLQRQWNGTVHCVHILSAGAFDHHLLVPFPFLLPLPLHPSHIYILSAFPECLKSERAGDVLMMIVVMRSHFSPHRAPRHSSSVIYRSSADGDRGSLLRRRQNEQTQNERNQRKRGRERELADSPAIMVRRARFGMHLSISLRSPARASHASHLGPDLVLSFLSQTFSSRKSSFLVYRVHLPLLPPRRGGISLSLSL